MSRKAACSSVWIIGLLILAIDVNRASGQISCLEALASLMPCQAFLLGESNTLTVPCCQGAASLDQLVKSNPGDLKSICECLKQASTSMGVKTDRAQQIPQLCNITVPVPIDPNVNCSSL